MTNEQIIDVNGRRITEDSRKRKQNLELDNNIQTIINGEVRMVNIASGISNKTFHFMKNKPEISSKKNIISISFYYY